MTVHILFSKPTSPGVDNIKKSEEKSTKVKFVEAKKPKLIPSISTLGIDMPSQVVTSFLASPMFIL